MATKRDKSWGVPSSAETDVLLCRVFTQWRKRVFLNKNFWTEIVSLLEFSLISDYIPLTT